MNSKDINLLPDQLLYRSRKVLRLCIGVLALVILGGMILYGYNHLVRQRMLREQQLEELITKVDTQILERMCEAQEELQRIIEEKQRVSSMLSSIPAKPFEITRLVARLTGLLPVTVKILDIKYHPDSGSVDLGCEAGNRKDIALFLERLHDDLLFIDITISTIYGSETAFNFSVALKVQQPT